MMRKYSPAHDYWHKRVEGQIKDCMNQHPQWFNYRNELAKRRIVNSLAKRIVGEIVVGCGPDDDREQGCLCDAPVSDRAGDGSNSVPGGGGDEASLCPPRVFSRRRDMIATLALVAAGIIVTIIVATAIGLGKWWP